MTNRKPSPCMVCGKSLEPVFKNDDSWDSWRQPSGAAEFVSTGHYGSNFDPMDGRVSITINVCDECLAANRLRVVYVTEERQEPNRVYTEFMPWLGSEPSDAGGES